MRAQEEEVVRHQEQTVRALQGQPDAICPFDRKCVVENCSCVHPFGREVDDERLAQMMHWEVCVSVVMKNICTYDLVCAHVKTDMCMVIRQCQDFLLCQKDT
jgi:hypothetical protein